MRILPISSGKGGIGKTTFALNLALALAKTRSTVLIDLDTGTSSLRNFLDMPVGKDLFHYLKKETPLAECRHALPPSMDPDRAFANFSFIASPAGFIQDIVNLSPATKEKLIRGINSLQADFVIIDLKAGLDTNVLDFLPLSNSGIILFTPRLRAATLAAAEMAKAILFRMLELMLTAPPLLEKYSGPGAAERPAELFRRLRDFLQSGAEHETKNLDDFLSEAAELLPQDDFIRIFRHYVENYKIYFVLNKFNSVAESVQNTIQPFVEKIFRTVSSKVSFHNLGWLVDDNEISRCGECGVPYLVRRHYQKKRPPQKSMDFDAQLRTMFGLESKQPLPRDKKDIGNELHNQIDLLRKIYVCNAGNDPETNLDFVAARVKDISTNSSHQFGMRRIYSEREFLDRFLARLANEGQATGADAGPGIAT